jgi:DNA gyrase subunit A
MKLIEELQKILADERLVYEIIVKELNEIKVHYGDKRRTEIKAQLEEVSEEDLIEEEEMVVTITHAGYIKRNPATLYRSQRRGGKGKVGAGVKEEDFVTSLFVASTHSYVLAFSDRGRLYWIKVHELPMAGRAAKGKPIVNVCQMSASERVTALLPVKEFVEGKFIVMATRNGIIKKTDLMQFSNPRASGIIACGIEDGDRMISAALTDGQSDILLATKNGQAIRFREDEVRGMGRQAVGVWGIDLQKGDAVVAMEVLKSEGTLLTATEHGYGKRTETTEYRKQSRGGKGIMTIKVTDRNGPVVGLAQVAQDDDVMLISDQGQLIRVRAKDISVIGRATQGVRLITLAEGEKLMALAKIVPEDDETEAPAGNA